ncbi:MAG TPA: hypothetical protein VD970_11875, partial [Acetobacteraceae bacterium]|nr:hypothetical protein [Acetobacteraceae bacterium]
MSRACVLLLVGLLIGCKPLVAQQDDKEIFEEWLKTHSVVEFEAYLAASKVNGVLPTRYLLRTA